MNKPRFQFLLNQQKKTIETANESKCLYLGIKQATNSSTFYIYQIQNFRSGKLIGSGKHVGSGL